MSCKSHFVARREDANARICVRRRENERRFGQVELPCKCLQRSIVQTASVFEDAQRITRERTAILGENVYDAILILAHSGTSTNRVAQIDDRECSVSRAVRTATVLSRAGDTAQVLCKMGS